MHTDVLLGQFRDFLSKLGFEFEVLNVGTDEILLSVKKGDYATQVQANVTESSYSFMMLDGNVTSYRDFDEFKENFEGFYRINIELAPAAQVVANTFATDKGINFPFGGGFVGDLNNGFKIAYFIDGDANSVGYISKQTENTFILEFIDSINKSKYNLSDIYAYKIDNDTCFEIAYYDIKTYVNSMIKRYESDDRISVTSEGGMNQFCVKFEDEFSTIYYTVEFPFNESVEYYVNQISLNGDNNIEEVNLKVVLDDPYNLEELLAKVKESFVITKEEPVVEDSTTPEVESEVSDTIEAVEESAKEEVHAKPKLNSIESLMGMVPMKANVATDTVKEEVKPVVEEAPATAEVTEEPATTDVTEEPATAEVTEEPATAEVTEEPATDEVTEEPATDEVTEEPVSEIRTNVNVSETAEATKVNNVQEEVGMTNEELVFNSEDDFVLECVVEDDKPVLVRFSYSDKIIDIDFEKAKSLNVPVHKITKKIALHEHHGIKVTDEELTRRIFSIYVEDDATCEKIVEGIYN